MCGNVFFCVILFLKNSKWYSIKKIQNQAILSIMEIKKKRYLSKGSSSQKCFKSFQRFSQRISLKNFYDLRIIKSYFLLSKMNW